MSRFQSCAQFSPNNSNDGSTSNPFEDEQLVLASVDWLASHPRRAEQALAAGWDLLLVDEAHHLTWTPEHKSPAYDLVEELAAMVAWLASEDCAFSTGAVFDISGGRATY